MGSRPFLSKTEINADETRIESYATNRLQKWQFSGVL